MDHPASIGEIQQDECLTLRSTLGPTNIAVGTLPGRTRVFIKFYHLYASTHQDDMVEHSDAEDEVPEPTWRQQQKVLRDFFQELLEASEKLRHRHIVPILGFRVNIMRPYLFQPRYISMDLWLTQHHTTELHERLRLLREAGEGLRYLHEVQPAAMPWHGQVHLNNILLRPMQAAHLEAAISDVYQLRALRHAYRTIHAAYGAPLDDNYPSELRGAHLYITPELLRDSSWTGSQSEDVCTFGLSILHAITRDWPTTLKGTFRFDKDKRMIWRTPNPFDYPDSLPAEDPLWSLLYSMFRTADQRPTMTEVINELDKRIAQGSHKSGTDEESEEQVPETTLTVGEQVEIRNLLAAEVSDLELGIKMSDDLPLISETQFAKVRLVRLREADGKVSDVAVKEIRVRLIDSSLTDTERAIKRMLREAKAWRSLKHIYILPLLGFKVYGTNPCLISPWCPEGDLELYVERNSKLSLEEKLKLAIKVGLGIRFIHDQPIMHGDIKPKNVLIYQGNPAISDFGTARWTEQNLDETTTQMAEALTARYASPERMAESRSKTTKSDVWSFGGLTLFVKEVLSGKPPYFQHGRVEMRKRVLGGKVPEPMEYKSIPLDHPVWAILRLCWMLEPADRLTMAEVMRLLHGVADQKGIDWPPEV